MRIIRKLAFVFPGQGSQHVGMGKSLYEQYDDTKTLFLEANHQLGFDLREFCFEGSLRDMSRLDYALPAIYVVSVAYYYAYMRDIGIRPQFLAGHSLGEYSALVCSGVLSFRDGLSIVRERSRYAIEVGRKRDGYMTIIDGISANEITKICSSLSSKQELVQIACYNCADQVVVSGHTALLGEVEEKALSLGASVTPILTGAPFHCALMEEMKDKLRDILIHVEIRNPRYPVLMNVDGRVLTNKERVVTCLLDQLVRPVQWEGIVQFLDTRMDDVLELGPSTVLTDLAQRDYRKARYLSYHGTQSPIEVKMLFNTSNSGNSERGYTMSVITGCLAIVASTRNENPNNNEYEEVVQSAYNELLTLLKETEDRMQYPDDKETEKALLLLDSILSVKKLPQDVKRERVRKLLSDTGTEHIYASITERDLLR